MEFIVVAPAHRCGNLPWSWPHPTWTARGTRRDIMEQALRDVLDPVPKAPHCAECSTPADLARILGVHPRHLHIMEA